MSREFKLLEKYVEASTGSAKYIFRHGELIFESAFLVFGNGEVSMCISTQIGCGRRCSFCAMTYLEGPIINLDSSSILHTVHYLLQDQQEAIQRSTKRLIDYSGHGEPIDNWRNVYASFLKLRQELPEFGFSFYTTGSFRFFQSILEMPITEPFPDIIYSLHASEPEQRSVIMPVEKQAPFRDMLDLLTHIAVQRQCKITCNYILFQGFNDTQQDAEHLARVFSGRESLFTLHVTRYNPIGLAPFSIAQKTSEQFVEEILHVNPNVQVLAVRCMGTDVDKVRHRFGCGQLMDSFTVVEV